MATRRTYMVTVLIEGDADRFDDLFREYLTTPEYPFLVDYGPRAWGGWDGPTVAAVAVEVAAAGGLPRPGPRTAPATAVAE